MLAMPRLNVIKHAQPYVQRLIFIEGDAVFRLRIEFSSLL